MEVWCWTDAWNCPRRIDDTERNIAEFVEKNNEDKTSEEYFFFFAVLDLTI